MSPSIDQRENRDLASEIKFVVTPPVAGRIREWARAQLAPDPNASGEWKDAYQITSLYFDTDEFDVFHRKGSFGRSKYRVRRYGESEAGFLERKLKRGSLLTKRRSIIDLVELERLTSGEAERGWGGYWFHRRILARRLKPICQITYRRTAHVATTGYGPIRLTLDDTVRALPTDRLWFQSSQGENVLAENQVILELKYRYELPVLFKLLVEEFALVPQRISKYRLAATALGYGREAGLNGATKGEGPTSVCLTS